MPRKQGTPKNVARIKFLLAITAASLPLLTILHGLRLLYGVLEGHPSGRMSEAAELLLAAAREDEGNSQILYNSRLRFSDRRYCVADLIQTFELKVPLNEIMTPMGLQGKSDSSSLLAFSGLSKLQMATLLSRAADLKCQDLFPTSMELKSIRQLNFL